MLLLLLLLLLPFNVIIVPSNTVWSGPALAIYRLEGQQEDDDGVVVIVVVAALDWKDVAVAVAD
jgi:hypothetical protein